jgi:hypothetical protein
LAFTILVALLGMIAGSVSVFPLKDFFLEGFWQNFLSWTTLILFLFVPAIGLLTWLVRRIIGATAGSKYLGFTFGGLWTLGWISVVLLIASIAFSSVRAQPFLFISSNFPWLMNQSGYSFFRSFNLPLTIVRPFNTYGPRQSARAIIPTIISQLLNGAREIKLGDVSPKRDLLFVKDTISGFVKIAQCDSLIGHEVNIATESEVSIGDLANILINKINPKAKIISDPIRLRPKNSEVYRLFGSNKKLKSFTDWEQKYSIEEGLEETINWFSKNENLKFYKSDIYNI